MAEQEGAKSLVISLVSQVAQSYITLLALDHQLKITKEIVANLMQQQKMIQDRFRFGLASDLDLKQAESQTVIASEQIPIIEKKIVQNENNVSEINYKELNSIVANIESKFTLPLRFNDYIETNFDNTISGRYIKLYLSKQDYMNIAQIQVFSTRGGANIINPNTIVEKSSTLDDRIYGVDKIIDRMKKAMIDAELKKRMTERSEFSGGNYKKVKKIIKKEFKII
jgi:hypothetical protein